MHAVGVPFFSLSRMAGTMSDCGHGSEYILMAQGAAFSAHPETPEQARRLSHSDSDVFVAHKAHAHVPNTTLALRLLSSTKPQCSDGSGAVVQGVVDVGEILTTLDRTHVVLVGPGLGRADGVMAAAAEVRA